MEKRKILILGDTERATYHPMAPVLPMLEGILEDCTIDCELDYLEKPLDLSGYDVVISYIDRWVTDFPRGLVASILSFVAGGGGLLSLHNGVAIQGSPELAQLQGGRFTHHPPYATLTLTPQGDHPIVQGMSGFELDDEPYRFEVDEFAGRTVLMRYTHEGSEWDAAWCRDFGHGRVVYLMPGHTASSFGNPEYQGMIRRSVLWLTESLR